MSDHATKGAPAGKQISEFDITMAGLDARAIRLECLRLAVSGERDGQEIERARSFAAFIMGAHAAAIFSSDQEARVGEMFADALAVQAAKLRDSMIRSWINFGSVVPDSQGAAAEISNAHSARSQQEA